VKPNVYRVYLNHEDTLRMKSICAATELGQSELLSKIVVAGLRSIEENHNAISLPLRFSVVCVAQMLMRKAKKLGGKKT